MNADSVHALSPAYEADRRQSCAGCSSRTSCLASGLSAGDTARLGTVTQTIKQGQYLFRAGAELQSLCAIRSGSMKRAVMESDGREQIVSFLLPGDLIGIDAIDGGRHVCDVLALEDSEVCRIPFAGLRNLCREIPALARNLHANMSREIGRGYGIMLMLGGMNAEQRLAAFLLDLSDRLLARGYPPCEFVLRMTRNEIGSYLGMKLETVSRMFTQLQRHGAVAAHGKEIRVIDPSGLKSIVFGAPPVREVSPARRMPAVPANMIRASRGVCTPSWQSLAQR